MILNTFFQFWTHFLFKYIQINHMGCCIIYLGKAFKSANFFASSLEIVKYGITVRCFNSGCLLIQFLMLILHSVQLSINFHLVNYCFHKGRSPDCTFPLFQLN